MKYNDYPMLDDEIINVLQQEYGGAVKSLNLLTDESSSEKNKLSELYVYLTAQCEALCSLKRNNKHLNIRFKTEEHLKLLESMGIKCDTVKINSNFKSCFSDYLKTEVEILKLLMGLLLLNASNLDKVKLTKILYEQLEIFNDVAYF